MSRNITCINARPIHAHFAQHQGSIFFAIPCSGVAQRGVCRVVVELLSYDVPVVMKSPPAVVEVVRVPAHVQVLSTETITKRAPLPNQEQEDLPALWQDSLQFLKQVEGNLNKFDCNTEQTKNMLEFLRQQKLNLYEEQDLSKQRADSSSSERASSQTIDVSLQLEFCVHDDIGRDSMLVVSVTLPNSGFALEHYVSADSTDGNKLPTFSVRSTAKISNPSSVDLSTLPIHLFTHSNTSHRQKQQQQINPDSSRIRGARTYLDHHNKLKFQDLLISPNNSTINSSETFEAQTVFAVLQPPHKIAKLTAQATSPQIGFGFTISPKSDIVCLPEPLLRVDFSHIEVVCNTNNTEQTQTQHGADENNNNAGLVPTMLYARIHNIARSQTKRNSPSCCIPNSVCFVQKEGKSAGCVFLPMLSRSQSTLAGFGLCQTVSALMTTSIAHTCDFPIGTAKTSQHKLTASTMLRVTNRFESPVHVRVASQVPVQSQPNPFLQLQSSWEDSPQITLIKPHTCEEPNNSDSDEHDVVDKEEAHRTTAGVLWTKLVQPNLVAEFDVEFEIAWNEPAILQDTQFQSQQTQPPPLGLFGFGEQFLFGPTPQPLFQPQQPLFQPQQPLFQPQQPQFQSHPTIFEVNKGVADKENPSIRHSTITALPEYENISLEELRLRDTQK